MLAGAMILDAVDEDEVQWSEWCDGLTAFQGCSDFRASSQRWGSQG